MSPLSNATTLANYASGIGTQGATLEIDSNNKRVGIGTTNPQGPEGSLQVGTAVTISGNSGIVSATTFHGDFGSSTSVAGNLTVSGVITYEDVTNIDSIGIMTARSDLSIADKIIHTGDTNTAIRFPAADTVTIETAGSERLRIDNSGNFGFGTSTISDSTNYTNVAIGDASGGLITFLQGSTESADIIGGSGLYLRTRDASPITFRTNGSNERMRIDSSGNVGVGLAPGVKFDIDVTNSALRVKSDTTDAQILITSDDNSNAVINFGDESDNDRGSITYDNPNNALIFQANTQERLRIDSSGRMGLGTASPNRNLEISASSNPILRLNNSTNTITTGSDIGGIEFYTNDASGDGTGIKSFIKTVAGSFGSSQGNAHLTFGVATQDAGDATERMRIDSSGHMGLGTNSPKRQLHIHGGNETVKIQITNTTTGSANDGEGFQIGIAANGDAFLEQRENSPLIFYTNNTEAMRLDSSRRLLIGTTAGAAGRVVHASNSGSNSAYFHSTNGSTGTGSQDGIVMGMGDATNAYFWNYESGSIVFATSATSRMTIDSSGRVLVGQTVSSLEPLVVKGDGGGIQINRNASGSPTSGQDLGSIGFKGVASANSNASSEVRIRAYADENHSGSTAASGLAFETKPSGTGPGSAPTERMRIDSSGNVGINESNPIADLSITGANGSTMEFQPDVVSGTNRLTNFNRSTSTYKELRLDASLHDFYISGSSKMRLDSSGRVLIGTTTEGHQNADNLTIADSGDSGITIRSGTSSNGRIYFSDGTSGGAEYNGSVDYDHANNSLSFFTVGAQRMRLDSDGGVFIGNSSDYSNTNYTQTSGSGNLYYKKDNGSSGGTIIASNNADRGWALAYLNKFAYGSGDDNRFIAWYVNGVSRATINWDGSSVIYAGNSDYRLKTNASDYAGGIEKVKKLQVREYEWIDNPDAGRCVGFYAHELQEIYPGAVTGVKDGMKIDEFTEEEVPEYQGIDYGKITPLLTKALQEAIAKIETLEAKVAALEAG